MKKIVSLCAVLFTVVAMAGCAGSTESTQGGSSNNTPDASSDTESASGNNALNDIASGVSQFLEANGREYGKTYTAKIGEKISNEFFSMTVNEAYKMTSVSGYTPDDKGYEFLCVNVTSENIFSEPINVGAYDFTVRWGDGEEDFDYAIQEEDDFGYDIYPYGADLAQFESVTGNVYFLVPKNATDIKFEYLEIYEDDFSGNTYQIDLGALSYRDDPYVYEDPDGNWGYIGDILSTKSFDMTVNDIMFSNTLFDYEVDPGYKFLSVNVTLTNTSLKAIDVGGYYFCTYWGTGDEDYMYSLSEDDIGAVDFPYVTKLARGESITGNMFYVVPDTAEEIIFEYADYIDDETYEYYSVSLGGVTASA